MKQSIRWITSRGFWRDTQGQDLIEYALMVGFVAVAATAVMPAVAGSITTIFTAIQARLAAAAGAV